MVADSLPPVVKIVSPSDRSSVATSPIAVTYQVRSPTPVTGITVLVDGRPVATAPPPEDNRLASLSIDMPPHNAVISLVAANEKASSEAAVVHIGWQGAKDWYKPDLYVLAVGRRRLRQGHAGAGGRPLQSCLLTWFTRIGVAALVYALASTGIVAQETSEGIRVMAREKSLAETVPGDHARFWT